MELKKLDDKYYEDKPKAQWPEEVPVLQPEDFTRGAYRYLDRQCCLLGWAATVFGRDKKGKFITDTELIQAMEEVIREGYDTTEYTSFHSHRYSLTVWFNDKFATPRDQADVWNKTMERLGYTEDSKDDLDITLDSDPYY